MSLYVAAWRLLVGSLLSACCMQLRVAFGFGQEQELAKLHVKMSKATTEDLKAFAKIVEVERGGTKVLLLCGSDRTTGSLWCNVLAYKARLHATE